MSHEYPSTSSADNAMPEAPEEGPSSAEAQELGTCLADNEFRLPSEDIVHAMVPLMREVAALHAEGRVARLGPASILVTGDGRFTLKDASGTEPSFNHQAVLQVQPHITSALKLVGEYRVTDDEARGKMVDDLLLGGEGEEGISRPCFLTGLRSWEIELGHHDDIADIFQIGLIMACISCGVDPASRDDMQQLVRFRHNLLVMAPTLHPVIASLIMEAMAINRHDRATDLTQLADRLENYRDQPAAIDVEGAMASASGIPGRRVAVLAHLRDRLFDLSRRNRLIHFRPTQASLNLTEASIPIVMRLESIRANELCTWSEAFAKDVLSGKSISLNRWLRFEDQPHLPSSLDRILQEARRNRAEYGFSNMRLVVGFLRWRNLKEAPNEPILSPLLWLPVEVVKKKGVRDQFMLRCETGEAEYNPALRHMLRQLYAIDLPETVDLVKTPLARIHADLAAQIAASEPAVKLELQSEPQISLILQRAVQRVNRFRKRRAGMQRRDDVGSVDFSYDRDDFRPRGKALFEKFVKPAPLPQRLAAGGSLQTRSGFMVDGTEAMTYVREESESTRYGWSIDLTQVTLANLNYRKMALVRDYAELIDTPSELPGFDQVFSIDPRPFASETPPPLPVEDQWMVVPSDATQDAAVAMARSGRSFIIQGPPGTGKSQTITNLIADYAARGKRVLFVCEKRAALDVVFHRLGQARLADLTCIIHDSQEDKKGFVMDLKDHYGKWGRRDDRLNQLAAERDTTVAAARLHLGALMQFDRIAGSPGPAETPQTLRELVRRAADLPFPPLAGQHQRERLPGLAAWDRQTELAQRLFRAVRQLIGHSSLAAHPLSRLDPDCLGRQDAYSSAEAAITSGEELARRIALWCDAKDSSAASPGAGMRVSDAPLEDLAACCATARRMVAAGLAGNLALLDPASPEARELEDAHRQLSRIEEEVATARQAAANWQDALTASDTVAAVALAEDKEGSFFNFLSGQWRALKKTVEERYDFSAHAVRPRISAVLQLLADLHEAEARLDNCRSELRRRFGMVDPAEFLALVSEFRAGQHGAPLGITMLAFAGASGDSHVELKDWADQASGVVQLLQTLQGILPLRPHETASDVGEVLAELLEAIDDLPDFLPLFRELDQGDPDAAALLRDFPASLAELEALVVDEAIARRERADPEIRQFDIDRLQQLTRQSGIARGRMLDQNADVIEAGMQRRFRDNVRLSEASVTGLNTAQREFKKLYAQGRRQLEHEFGKTMRYRSIRDLAGGESGAVINDLKPIWLMSPLSVSDTLPLRQDLFDVVIFDEASQIPTEDAVPALCRARQVVIVGDEMQLPPTSFFSAARDEDELQVTAMEDGEKIAIQLDADSLLNQSARNLPATLLAWHYRSRSEALISFSNAAFYNGQLVTIPDSHLRMVAAQPSLLNSENPEDWKAGVDRLLSMPITTHRLADGCYQARTNLAEARYIAALVRELLERKTGLSLGVVAFSESQQGQIEDALEQIAAENPAFAALLENEYTREDDGQFNGLFVKNLENVQGDERDIILMSVCYGPGRDGRMAMNFGPINQRGGEKRLNVIFSRARRHMAIVSTIAPEAITNVHNDGARALRGFLSFAEAQSAGEHDLAQAVLSSMNSDAASIFQTRAPADSVRDAIAQALRERGHDVHVSVGGASFRCDLAIVAKDGGSYALGILLDGEKHLHTPGGVPERFVFRPDILRAFGWRVIDVPVAAWLRAKDAVVSRIESELARSHWDEIDEEPSAPVKVVPAPPVEKPAAQAEAEVEAKPAAADRSNSGLREYRVIQGTSRKFWRIGTSGCDVIVEFGRIGTAGRRLVKTYDLEERAVWEMDKLVREKTGKGYEAVD